MGVDGCAVFHAALRKYGRNAFQWTIIGRARSFKAMSRLEIHLIKLLKPEYNITQGGVGVLGFGRKPVICLNDGELYESLSAAALAYDACDSEISKNCYSKKGSVKGFYFSFGTRPISGRRRRAMILNMIEISASKRRKVKKRKINYRQVENGRDSLGRKANGPLSRARQVICLDDLEIYPSAVAAALHYDVAKSALIELCLRKNGRITVSGKRFCYLEDYKPEMATKLAIKQFSG